MNRTSLIFALFLTATVAMVGTLSVSLVLLMAKPYQTLSSSEQTHEAIPQRR